MGARRGSFAESNEFKYVLNNMANREAFFLQKNFKKNMIRKLKSGEYRLYSRKIDPKTKKRRNLGTFQTRQAAQKHEREVQYFKRH